MKIDWVNHASFILEHSGIRLITDPWIEGPAFDHGWKHLVPTQFSYEDFATITHIWISHEHPDHFAPKNLQAIPAAFRSRITVMYHRGVDHRIGAFCRNAGFKAIKELQPGAWLELADDLRVRCEEAGSGDSWIAFRSSQHTVVNVNDSFLAHRWRIRRIGQMVGAPIDVLLTQFSYANWLGNPEDVAPRQAEALDHLKRMALQCSVLQPRFVIPFASMVWFCHEENAYLNADMNTIPSAYGFLKQNADARPVVLFPGESWTVGEEHDSEASIERYAPYYEAVRQKPQLLTSPSTSIAELQRLGGRFSKLLARNNPPWALALARRLGLIGPTHAWLWDHEKAVRFDLRDGLTISEFPAERCDVAMSSESLAYMFRFLWGGATVSINGRFRTPTLGNFNRFRRYILIATYNNRGWSMLRYIPVALARLRDRMDRGSGISSQRALS